MIGGPFRRARDGSIEARMGAYEAEAIARIARELGDVLEQPDDATRRLYPPAYEDADRQREYVSMTREQLVSGKRAAAEAVVRSIERGSRDGGDWRARLDEEEQGAWLRVLNDLRLVLGTRLEVDEETADELPSEEDSLAPAMAMYRFLGWVQEMLVEEMAAGLVVPGEHDER